MIFLATVVLLSVLPIPLQGQNPPAADVQDPNQNPSIDETLVAGEAGAEDPARKLITWNEYLYPGAKSKVNRAAVRDCQQSGALNGDTL